MKKARSTKHEHTWHCLSERGRQVCPVRSLTYKEWVKLAAGVPDQDQAWRFHELQARQHARSDEAAYVDLGGEA